jgi:hypothetical protein
VQAWGLRQRAPGWREPALSSRSWTVLAPECQARPASALRQCRRTGAGGGLELVQLVDVLRQFRHAVAAVLCLAGLCHLLVGGAGGGTALRDGELVRCAGRGIAIFDVGLQLARGIPARCRYVRGRRVFSQALAVGAEIAALRSDGAARFRGRHGGRFGGAGQVEHGASTHAIDVATNECIGVGQQQRDQHLVERHVCGLVGACDLAGGVAALNGDLLAAAATAGAGRCGCRDRSRGWRRSGCRGRGRDSRRCDAFAASARGGGCRALDGRGNLGSNRCNGCCRRSRGAWRVAGGSSSTV